MIVMLIVIIVPHVAVKIPSVEHLKTICQLHPNKTVSENEEIRHSGVLFGQQKFSIETPSPIILINTILISGKTFHTNVFHKKINTEISFSPSSLSKKIPLEKISFFFPSSYYLKDGRSELHLPYCNVSSRDDSLCLVLVDISLSTRLPRIRCSFSYGKTLAKISSWILPYKFSIEFPV